MLSYVINKTHEHLLFRGQIFSLLNSPTHLKNAVFSFEPSEALGPFSEGTAVKSYSGQEGVYSRGCNPVVGGINQSSA